MIISIFTIFVMYYKQLKFTHNFIKSIDPGDDDKKRPSNSIQDKAQEVAYINRYDSMV